MEPPDAVRSAPIAMTETSFLFIVLFLASMKDLPCCRVPAQLSMAYKEIFPCLASLALCCATPLRAWGRGDISGVLLAVGA